MTISEVFGPIDPHVVESMWDRGFSPVSGTGYEWLQLAVEGLPPIQREVFEALYWEQAGQREVAARLGMTRAEMRTHQRRGIRRLTEAMQVLCLCQWMAAQ